MSNRIYFANQQVSFKADAGSSWTPAHGVQTVGVATSFTLEQVFELGQLAIYENIEVIPEIEMSINKVLDGYPLLYHLATAGGSTLNERLNTKCLVAVGIWPDSVDGVSDNPSQQLEASGMVISSVAYNLPIDDNFTEDITLVGNDKAWVSSDCHTWAMANAEGYFDPDEPDEPPSGVLRREGFNVPASTLPSEIGVGTRDRIQNINVSLDLSRENLFELGSKRPYAKVVNFPVEVTCDIEVISISGDLINAFAEGCPVPGFCAGRTNNTSNQSISIVCCDGTTIDLGSKNRLSSVNYGGGDAGGGNVTVSYSYITFNAFDVTQA